MREYWEKNLQVSRRPATRAEGIYEKSRQREIEWRKITFCWYRLIAGLGELILNSLDYFLVCIVWYFPILEILRIYKLSFCFKHWSLSVSFFISIINDGEEICRPMIFILV